MKKFGELKNAFSEIFIESYIRKDENLKRIFQNYLKLLKEDRTLKTQAIVYGNLEKAHFDDDGKTILFIKENLELLKSLKQSEVKKANSKLEKLLESVKIEINYPEKYKKLHENIDNAVSTKFNIDLVIESTDNIKEYIKNNKKENTIEEAKVPTKLLAKLSTKKFNEKYQDLSEDEKKIIQAVIKNDETLKKETFNEVKKECFDLVNEQIKTNDLELKNKLLDVKFKLTETTYKPDSFVQDIEKLINLRETLKEN